MNTLDPVVISEQVLLEHGIVGAHTVDAMTTMSAWTGHKMSIKFVDPKDQFVYELKGGDSYFCPIILKMWGDNLLEALRKKTSEEVRGMVLRLEKKGRLKTTNGLLIRALYQTDA